MRFQPVKCNMIQLTRNTVNEENSYCYRNDEQMFCLIFQTGMSVYWGNMHVTSSAVTHKGDTHAPVLCHMCSSVKMELKDTLYQTPRMVFL